MHARLRGPNNLLILHQIINKTYFPCLADEIAEPRQDMNIKVTAFTVWHVKRSNIVCGNICIVYRNIYGLKHIFVD